MRAFVADKTDDGVTRGVRDFELDSDGDVLIRVQWSSVNYKDALATVPKGGVARISPLIPGIDLAGVVEEGPGFSPGDEVLAHGYELGMSHHGGFAEYARVPAGWVVPLRFGLSARDAVAIGTAGYTAALSILALERRGLTPADGPVLVTGATGGVGSIAIQCLAARGYDVTALTGKPQEETYLRSLGAREVLARSTLQMGTRPLEKAMWAGAVDPVGGATLAWLTRTMMPNGCIASSGLTGGADLQTTVMPFILRGVKLLGIDSVMCPMTKRLDVWRRLATDLKPARLAESAHEISLEELPSAFDALLKGSARGRYVVKLP
jgi:putative YhdH/YhfP family quinone oxidoreductase